MRTWQREIAVTEAQMRARYYERLKQVAKIAGTLARTYAETASIETMKIYLGEK